MAEYPKGFTPDEELPKGFTPDKGYPKGFTPDSDSTTDGSEQLNSPQGPSLMTQMIGPESAMGILSGGLLKVPGTERFTKPVFDPISKKIDALQGRIAESPTTEALAAPFKTALSVGKFTSEALAEGGLGLIDLALPLYSKLQKAAIRPYQKAVKGGLFDTASKDFLGDFTELPVKSFKSPIERDALSNELNRLSDMVESARKAGARNPETVMTSQEKALYDKYGPMIEQAKQFNIKDFNPMLTREEQTEFARGIAGKSEQEVGKAVDLPLSGPSQKLSVAPVTGDVDDVTAILQSRVGKVKSQLDETINNFEAVNERGKIVSDGADVIEATGTLEKEVRPELRALGKPGAESEIKAYRVSHNSIKKGAAEVIRLAREYKALAASIQNSGDSLSANLAGSISGTMDDLVKRMNKAAKEWTMQRYATNRALNSFNGAIPKDVIDTLKQTKNLVDGLSHVKERVPITENIVNTLKKVYKREPLRPGEAAQFGKDLVEQFRLNLFSVSSWTLDLFGNAAEQVAHATSGLGYDLGHLMKGNTSFPATQGLMMSLKDLVRNPGKIAMERMAEEFGQTVSGEIVKGGITGNKGIFYTRNGVISTIYDYAVGSPLYAKGLMDTASKRISSMSYMYRKAIEEAEAAGLQGSARKDFINQFVYDAPEKVVDDAIEFGNKAGFNRQLSNLEETISKNPVYKIAFDAFARWGFQFARWGAEMLGNNPKLFKKIADGTLTAPELSQYMTRTATGWGGLYMIDEALYDNVDWRSMEYVHENGNRTRLSNRDPISTGLWFLATIKGDKEKSLAALKFASIPGARIMAGEGGLLSGTLKELQRIYQNKNISPSSIDRGVTDIVNRMIPGQALMGAVKTLMDPVIRDGVGAGIPGVSFALDPVINPATGKPLRPTQKLPGLDIEVPSVLGTAIPGAERVLDPVAQLLYRYGNPVYRGLKSPVIGIQPSEMPEEMRREWTIQLGHARQRVFNRLINDKAALKKLESKPLHIASEQIQGMDREAAGIAKAMIIKKFKHLSQRKIKDKKSLKLLPERYKK